MKKVTIYFLSVCFALLAALLMQSCKTKKATSSYGSETKTYESQKKDLDKRRSARPVKRQNKESRYVRSVD